MIYYLRIQELRWKSHTLRAAASPETLEIVEESFHQGRIWWFKYNTEGGMLEAVDNIDERKYKARCTSTLAFCHGEGFGAIEYNPIRNTDQDWHHWWSLGFARIATNNGGAQYKIARNHAADQSQSVGANGSHWFHLFQNTNHHLTEGPGAPGIPMLTGAPSLIWGLAAFSFSEEEIPEGLQGVTRPDQPGRLYIPTSIEEPAGRSSQRALSCEIWVPKDSNDTIDPLYLC